MIGVPHPDFGEGVTAVLLARGSLLGPGQGYGIPDADERERLSAEAAAGAGPAQQQWKALRQAALAALPVAQRARMGQIEDAVQTAEYQDVLQQEADLTAGHGVLRVSGLISVSAPTLDELEAAVAAIEQSAIQASCETRRLVGQQAAAFTAAALPLCRTV